jgi:hypothetical protein
MKHSAQASTASAPDEVDEPEARAGWRSGLATTALAHEAGLPWAGPGVEGTTPGRPKSRARGPQTMRHYPSVLSDVT